MLTPEQYFNKTKHIPQLAQCLPLSKNIHNWSWIHQIVKSLTIVWKRSNQSPVHCISDLGTSIWCTWQHSIITINEGYRKYSILQCWEVCGAQEQGTHKRISTQCVPVYAIMEVHNGKGFLIRRYRRMASVYQSEELDNMQKWLASHFTWAWADAPNNLIGL